MVDKNFINQIVKSHFKVEGTVTIDDQGIVHVAGQVGTKHRMDHLPVKFGRVDGDFYCEEADLLSLEGAPTHVGKDFWCQYNRLTSLAHAPEVVGESFMCYYNQLTTLEHGPTHVGSEYKCYGNKLINLNGLPSHIPDTLMFTYQDVLPLLRALGANQLDIIDVPDKVLSILLKYRGQGKPGAIKAAAELIRAGYKENARW